ncbi:MAG: TPR end-of-group domain-containing protein [Terriglobales bacterium]
MRPAVEIELDLARYELCRLGRRVKLQKQAMELLIFLVARREQLVAREDIVVKLWRSKFFVDTDAAINNLVRKIRAALHDDPTRPRFIETVVGKGYRFVGPVRVIDGRVSQDRSFLLPGESGAWSEQSSLAVIPLVLVGKLAADDQGICLGFADALISRLGNIQGIDVLPLSSVLNIAPYSLAADIAARLRVRFVVHGAVQLAKGQWRLSLEVFDAHRNGPCFMRRRDFAVTDLPELENEIAGHIASALNRPLRPPAVHPQPRYSRDPMAYSEFMRGYALSSTGDSSQLARAVEHLTTSVTRDPAFSLAHASLSLACATQHYEFDPTSTLLDKAEFHCARALELNPELPEAHVANAFLLWGPSRNFQHLQAIAELKRALSLQSNLPHAYNRLGTILAHIGLLDDARQMYERGRSFHPNRSISHSIVQVYLWNQEYELARRETRAWREENPRNKYAIYFAPLPAMMGGDWDEAKSLLEEAIQVLPGEPLIISLHGLYSALTGNAEEALQRLAQACACPRSFGHAHHTYYQFACILAVLGRVTEAFEWLERSVNTGFACWPFFLKDRCLQSLRSLPEFDALISSLQARYPAELGRL